MYRYASQEALDKHEGSEAYKETFKVMTEEKLLTGPPTIVKGTFVAGIIQ